MSLRPFAATSGFRPLHKDEYLYPAYDGELIWRTNSRRFLLHSPVSMSTALFYSRWKGQFYEYSVYGTGHRVHVPSGAYANKGVFCGTQFPLSRLPAPVEYQEVIEPLTRRQVLRKINWYIDEFERIFIRRNHQYVFECGNEAGFTSLFQPVFAWVFACGEDIKSPSENLIGRHAADFVVAVRRALAANTRRGLGADALTRIKRVAKCQE